MSDLPEEVDPSILKLTFRKGNYYYSASFSHYQEEDTLFLEAKRLRFPKCMYDSPEVEPVILGSIHGMVFAYAASNCRLLWNPFAKSYHMLPEKPPSSIALDRIYWKAHRVDGVCYNPENVDYRLIEVRQFENPGKHFAKRYDSDVLVYSARHDSWRDLGDFPWYVHDVGGRINNVFVNGALHYIVSKITKGASGKDTVDFSTRFIAASDVRAERYRLIPHPPDCSRKNLISALGVLYGCLCVTLHFVSKKRFQFLIMKEYGERDSWTLLFAFENEYRMKPITEIEGGTQVLFDIEGTIFCFDRENESFRDVRVDFVEEVDFGEDDDVELKDISVLMESRLALPTEYEDLDEDGGDSEEENSDRDDQLQQQENAEIEDENSDRNDQLQQQGEAEIETKKSDTQEPLPERGDCVSKEESSDRTGQMQQRGDVDFETENSDRNDQMQQKGDAESKEENSGRSDELQQQEDSESKAGNSDINDPLQQPVDDGSEEEKSDSTDPLQQPGGADKEEENSDRNDPLQQPGDDGSEEEKSDITDPLQQPGDADKEEESSDRNDPSQQPENAEIEEEEPDRNNPLQQPGDAEPEEENFDRNDPLQQDGNALRDEMNIDIEVFLFFVSAVHSSSSTSSSS